MNHLYSNPLRSRQFEPIYIFCYCLIVVLGILTSSQVSQVNHWGNICKYSYAAVCIILVFCWARYGIIYKKTIPILIIIGITVPFVFLFADNNLNYLLTIILIITGICIGLENGVRAYLFAGSASVLFVLFLYRIGIFQDVTVERTGEDTLRYYLGFNYTTFLANYFFHIILAYFFLKKKFINIFETAVILLINYWIYRWTDTRAIYYEVILFILLEWMIRIIKKLPELKLVKWCMILIMPILTILSIVLAFQYNENNHFLYRLDEISSHRLRYANQGILEYGIPLFGSKIEWSTGKRGLDRFTDYFYIDSSYLNLLLTYGLIILAVVVIGFALMTKQEYTKKNFNRCIVISMLAIHSFTDPQLFEFRYNPLLIGIGSAYYHSLYSERESSHMVNHTITQDFDREISVGKLLCRALLQWRKILIVSLVVAVLFGGYTTYKDIRENQNGVSAEAEENYTKELKDYNRNRESYKTIIDQLQDNLQSKRDYMSESILATINPSETAEAVAKLVFTSTDESDSSNPGKDQKGSQILGIFETYINDRSWDDLATEYDTKSQYISELITVTPDYDANALEIKVFHNNLKDARHILEAVLKYAKSYAQSHPEIDNIVYQMNTTDISEKMIVEQTLRTWSTQRTNEINDLESAVRMAQQSQSNLERPSEPSAISRSSIIKNALKQAAVVFVVLIVALICLIMIIEALRNVVLSKEELSKRYGIRNIMLLDSGNHKSGKLDRLFRKWENTAAPDLDEADYYVLLDMIHQYSENAKNILLVGHNSDDALKKLKDHLEEIGGNTVFSCKEDLEADQDGLKCMEGADAVVLVESVERSKYRKIDRSVILLDNYGKPIIGTIVLA